ncbi:hypothetical protein KNP414_00853 [Paenibacillus mucilaginosus KNP414]|uniref:Uncharacterized protein n=1 Tax=Paenibacillus mucilaginosus (strain KNP414) TaxID=1036673 RepID=F8F4Q1_PAEMK|nr:hypothetical protein KNP414_00853 [Paenibacillus mucilaginosus KNP414]
MSGNHGKYSHSELQFRYLKKIWEPCVGLGLVWTPGVGDFGSPLWVAGHL